MKKKHLACSYHKVSDNRIINTINYFVNTRYQFLEVRFLGFIKTDSDCVTSLKIDGDSYIACQVFFCDYDYLIDDKNYKENPFVLMFVGVDDFSYAKRFKTKIEALEYFEQLNYFTYDIQTQCFGYN
jgi:hypothetical protein